MVPAVQDRPPDGLVRAKQSKENEYENEYEYENEDENEKRKGC